jgi:hypothetical protein
MVSQHSVSGVNTVHILLAKLSSVFPSAGHLLNLLEQAGEDVGVVVAVYVLETRHQSLETHTGIDVLSR